MSVLAAYIRSDINVFRASREDPRPWKLKMLKHCTSQDPGDDAYVPTWRYQA